MGAGNPILRSFDEDKFSPNTYFFDFSISIEFEEWKKEYCEQNNVDNISDEKAWEWISDEEFEDFINLFSSFCYKNKVFSFEYSRRNARYIDELSAGFRESGIIIAESRNCLIITSTDGENYHMPIAFIPNFKWESLYEEIAYENDDKIEWYNKRKLSWEDMIERKADKEYDKLLKSFHKEEKIFWQWFKDEYPIQEFLSERNGTWCSSRISNEELIKRFNLK